MESSDPVVITSQKNNEPEEKPIPEYFNLYPKINSSDENNNINININTNINVPYIKWDFDEQQKTLEQEQNNNDIYEMNEEFLESLLQRKSHFDKNKTINTMCNFIRNSKLIKKLEGDNTSDKKMDMETLVVNCAKSLGYVKLEKGEVLFKIGDIGDKFYFILSGKINILKLKELKKIFMTNVEYLQYCMFLIDNKEDYILNEVFKKNKKTLDITNTEDIIRLYRIVFIKILREKIISHSITTNEQLLNFFSLYNQDPSTFHILESDLHTLEEQIQKGVFGSARDWENYLLKRIRTTIKESIFFEDYEDMFKDRYQKYNIICYIYESFLFFGPGLFFGDFALDSENARRNATIRAEEKTYLAWMKSLDYANIIAPKRKIEKHNEIMFLYKNFFFRSANVFSFEKKYFHLFPPREFVKGDIMFSQNGIPKGLFFIKTGQIQIEIKVSLFELQYLIEKIFEKMIKNKFYKHVSTIKGANYLIDIETIKNIRKYLKDPILEKTKDKSKRFLEELNKRIKYKLTIITTNELIGLEEIFLGVSYLCSGEVISDKVICYELSEKQLNAFLEEEKSLILLYTKYSVNKIMALLDRLQNLRKNRIYVAKSKYENIYNINNIDLKQESMEKIEEKKEFLEDEKNSEIVVKNDNKEKAKDLNKDNNEIIDIDNDEDFNVIDLEQLANQKRKEFGNKYPLTKTAKLNIRKILEERNSNKNTLKKDRLMHYIFKNKKRKTEIKNQKKDFQKKNFSFFQELKEDKKKNYPNNSKNELIKYLNPEKKLQKDNSLLIGNTYIEVNKIKKEINDYNFHMNQKFNNNLNINNNNIYKPASLNSDSYSQIFELSQLRYPLSDRLEQNNNIVTNYNYNSMTIYKNTEGIKFVNEFKDTEKNYFLKKINNSNSQRFYFGKIKKRNASNTNSMTKTLTLSDNKINMVNVNLSQDQLKRKIKKKIIRKKELLPGIIKEFDKKMKKQMLNSYLFKKNSTKKDLFENKNDKEYNFNNKSNTNVLPKIFKKDKIN